MANERPAVDDFDYHLPRKFIAQKPLARRDAARLMVIRRCGGDFEHHVFGELPTLLAPGDLLVLNDTRVIPARFFARRATGGRVEGCFLRHLQSDLWEVLLKGRGRIRPGEQLTIVDDSDHPKIAILLEKNERQGVWHVRPTEAVDVLEFFKAVGKVPLPPYIQRQMDDRRQAAADRLRYQTVYARAEGAVAAPTAGLHFTKRLFERLASAGIQTAFVTLHVGLATFQPVRTKYVHEHRIHSEYYELSRETTERIQATRDRGGRIIAVGTTTVRALETAAKKSPLQERAEWTDLFIYPPFRFRLVDGMITNFHLPRTSLLMLVSAFVGRERLLVAYEEAKRRGYRFYSYGDAMLII